MAEGTGAGHCRQYRAGSHDCSREEAEAAEPGDHEGGGKLGLVERKEAKWGYVTRFYSIAGDFDEYSNVGFSTSLNSEYDWRRRKWVLSFFGGRRVWGHRDLSFLKAKPSQNLQGLHE
jgi:hypothetical protein